MHRPLRCQDRRRASKTVRLLHHHLREVGGVMSNGAIDAAPALELSNEELGLLLDILSDDDGETAVALEGLAAGKTIGQAIGLPPRATDLIYAQAYAQFNAGHPRRAQPLFAALCVLDGKIADHWLGLGVCLRHAGDTVQVSRLKAPAPLRRSPLPRLSTWHIFCWNKASTAQRAVTLRRSRRHASAPKKQRWPKQHTALCLSSGWPRMQPTEKITPLDLRGSDDMPNPTVEKADHALSVNVQTSGNAEGIASDRTEFVPSVAKGVWADDATVALPPNPESGPAPLTSALDDVSDETLPAETPLLTDALPPTTPRDSAFTLAGLQEPATALWSSTSHSVDTDGYLEAEISTFKALPSDTSKEIQSLILAVAHTLQPINHVDEMMLQTDSAESATSAVIYNAAMIPGWPFPSAFAKDPPVVTADKPAELHMTTEEMAAYLGQIAGRFGKLQTLRKRIAEVGSALTENKDLFTGLLQAIDNALIGLQASLQLLQHQLSLIPATDQNGQKRHRFKL